MPERLAANTTTGGTGFRGRRTTDSGNKGAMPVSVGGIQSRASLVVSESRSVGPYATTIILIVAALGIIVDIQWG